MKAVSEIPDDVLRVLIEDAQQCIDKETELIVELIRHNEAGLQGVEEAPLILGEGSCVTDSSLVNSFQG